MTKITGHAVDSIDVLHAIAGADPRETPTAFAREIGKDPSNLSKTLRRLRDDGMVSEGELALTDAGRMATRVISAEHEITVSGDNVLRLCHQLQPDPNNERKHIPAETVTEMKLSLLTKGQLQELIIRAGPPGEPDYVVIGETRWRGASEGAAEGLWDQPLRCRLVTEADAQRLMFMRLAENLHRTDLHRLDEGAAYRRLRDEFGMDVHRIAAELGGRRTAKHIADHIALVEKLPEADQARMYLPEDHQDHLRYVDARRLMQSQNAKPRPAVDVDAKEALVLLEIADRVKTKPSHDVYGHGRDGWTRSPLTPHDSVAAKGLQAKGLIDFLDETEGGARHWVRLSPNKKFEILTWVHEQGAMGLWSARAAVYDAGAAGSLEQTGRYATSWLNDPLPEPEPAASPPPAAPNGVAQSPAAEPVAPPQAHELEPDRLTPTQRRILREIAARSIHRHRLLDGWVLAQVSALADHDFQALWDLAFLLHRQAGAGIEVALTLSGRDHLKARGQSPQDGLSRNSCATPWLREALPNPLPGTGSEAVESEQPEPGSQPFEEDAIPPYLRRLTGAPVEPEHAALDLTDAQKLTLQEIAYEARRAPIRTPAEGVTGARAYEYWKHPDFQVLVGGGLLRMVQDEKRGAGWVAALTPRASNWCSQNPRDFTPPYATPWLNPPVADVPAAPKPLGPPSDPDMPRVQGWALPVLPPPSEIACSNCEKTFELSSDCTDLASTEQAHFFEFEAESAECPHCGAHLKLAGAIVTHVDRQGAAL